MNSSGAFAPTSGYEENPVFQIFRSVSGDALYSNMSQFPFRICAYNWLFYKSYAAFVRLWNLHGNESINILRLITFTYSLVGVAAMIWFLRLYAREFIKAKKLSQYDILLTFALSSILFLSPQTGWWNLTVRPDIPSLTLEFLAIIFTLRWIIIGASSHRNLMVASFLFYLAWSFKQSTVAGLIGICLCLSGTNRRALLFLMGPFVILVAVTIVAGGPNYISHLTAQAGSGGWDWRWTWVNLSGSFFAWGFIPLLTIPFCFRSCGDKRAQTVERSLVCCLMVATLIAIIGSGQTLASRNHYFSTWEFGILLFSCLFIRHLHSLTFRFELTSFAILALSMISSGLLVGMQPRFGTIDLDPVTYQSDEIRSFQLEKGPILTQEPKLARLALGSELGRVTAIEDALYSRLRRRGKFGKDAIEGEIEKLRYDALWLMRDPGGHWPTVALNAGYVKFMEYDHLEKYVRSTKGATQRERL